MISLPEYARNVGKSSNAINYIVKKSKKTKEAMQGHFSYGVASNSRSRCIYLDETAIDILNRHYGIGNEEAIPISKKTSVKAKKKSATIPYKRKYDEVQKKLVKSMETQDELRVEIDNLRVELANAKDEIIALHTRKLWQRIVN